MGNEYNQTAARLKFNMFVFGVAENGKFKMISVDSNGNKIECRYKSSLSVTMSISNLTTVQWDTASRNGSVCEYSVKHLVALPSGGAFTP